MDGERLRATCVATMRTRYRVVATISIDASIPDIGSSARSSPPRAARQTAPHAPRVRRRAPPPERDVRAAVRDPEPVRLRARLRGGRRARARRGWASTSRRTARPPRPARSAATCSRASPAAATGRSCSARTSTPCPRTATIEPILDDGAWVSAGETILGADNKAAVAVILEVARRCAVEGAPVGLELLFTVGEEKGLAGALAFDVGTLRSDWGYVFDHASPIGEIIVASPTYYRFEASFRGAAAHAGIRPEDGRSAIEAAARAIAAMRLGRIDHETTANVASIPGGAGRDEHRPRALPDRGGGPLARPAQGRGRRRRAHRPRPRRGQHAALRLRRRRHDGAALRRLPPRAERARGARRRAGAARARLRRRAAARPAAARTPTRSSPRALHCTNLANGTEYNHEHRERVSVAALEGMLDVTYALLDACSD